MVSDCFVRTNVSMSAAGVQFKYTLIFRFNDQFIYQILTDEALPDSSKLATVNVRAIIDLAYPNSCQIYNRRNLKPNRLESRWNDILIYCGCWTDGMGTILLTTHSASYKKVNVFAFDIKFVLVTAKRIRYANHFSASIFGFHRNRTISLHIVGVDQIRAGPESSLYRSSLIFVSSTERWRLRWSETWQGCLTLSRNILILGGT